MLRGLSQPKQLSGAAAASESLLPPMRGGHLPGDALLGAGLRASAGSGRGGLGAAGVWLLALGWRAGRRRGVVASAWVACWL